MIEPSISVESTKNGLVIRLLEEFMVFPDQFDPIQTSVDAALAEEVESKQILWVVLNCQQVTHFSSVSLGKLVALHKTLARGERELRLCGLGDSLQSIMQATQLDSFFSLHADEAAALSSS